MKRVLRWNSRPRSRCTSLTTACGVNMVNKDNVWRLIVCLDATAHIRPLLPNKTHYFFCVRGHMLVMFRPKLKLQCSVCRCSPGLWTDRAINSNEMLCSQPIRVYDEKDATPTANQRLRSHRGRGLLTPPCGGARGCRDWRLNGVV